MEDKLNMEEKLNQENQNPKARKRRIIFRTINIIVVVGLGIFLVYYLLSRVNFSDIKSAFLNMYVPYLVIGLVIMFIGNIARAYQKKILIGSPRMSMVDLFLVTLVRNAFNMVLPARTGELSYVYVLNRKFKFPVEIGFSTLILILIFDLVIVFSLIVVAIIIVGINKYSISSTTVILIAVGLLVIVMVILFYLSKIIGLLLRFFNFILSRYKIGRNKMVQYIYKKLIDINTNIELIQKRKIYWKVYLSALVIRVLKFVAYYFIIYAILKPEGYGFKDISFWVIFLGTVVAEISAVLPTHALAGFGTYEAAFVGAFILLGFGLKISGIIAFNYHLIILLFSVILGLIAIIILSLPFYKVREEVKSN
jgi:glycosyltransferase 2 family protein